jgi:long-chain fatty acid transport protein
MADVRLRVIAAGIALFLPSVARAQTSLQIPLQFDFLNPGAKSLAMAGAFVGLADDATATFANPAGLIAQLKQWEFSFEFRGTHIETPFLQRGRLSGTITNTLTDTIQGPVFGDSVGTHSGAGFLSFVYAAPSRRWFVAGYRHELVRVDQTFLSDGVFQQDPAELTSRRDAPQQGDREVSITTYGLGGAYKVNTWLAAGASLGFNSFSIDSLFRRFDVDGFFGPPKLNVELARSTQIGSDVGVSLTLGTLVQQGNLRLGAVYRHGATFDFETKSGNDPALHSKFRVPNTFAVGASYQVIPTPKPGAGAPPSILTLAAEITEVTYSRLRLDFVTDQAKNSGRADQFLIDNGLEVHGGAEYMVSRWPLTPAFRGGIWFDPDHSVRYEIPASATALDRVFDERMTVALSTGKNLVHYTGGVGVTYKRLLVNFGIDLASSHRTISTSVIVH